MAPASCGLSLRRQRRQRRVLGLPPPHPPGAARRRAPRVAVADPARESSSCRPSLCPARPALVLKDGARGRWAQAMSAGNAPSPPNSYPAPTHTPKLGPTRPWVTGKELGAPEREQPPNVCPGSFPPLLPPRKEFTPEFRTEEVFHHSPDPYTEMPEGLGVTSAEKTVAFRFERKLVSSWAWLSQAVL